MRNIWHALSRFLISEQTSGLYEATPDSEELSQDTTSSVKKSSCYLLAQGLFKVSHKFESPLVRKRDVVDILREMLYRDVDFIIQFSPSFVRNYVGEWESPAC